jgi:hypothetical protein
VINILSPLISNFPQDWLTCAKRRCGISTRAFVLTAFL